MKIVSIYWRRNNFSQVRRILLGIKSSDKWKSFRKDHALEWGEANENPGIWSEEFKFIGAKNDPSKIVIENSINDFLIWNTDNKERGDRPKISQRIWENKEDIIEAWYKLNCYLIYKILEDLKDKEISFCDDQTKLYNYFLNINDKFLKISQNNITEDFLNISKIQKDLSSKELDMEWFVANNLKQQIEKYINSSFLLIVKCHNQNNTFYYADVFSEQINNQITNIFKNDFYNFQKNLGVKDISEKNIIYENNLNKRLSDNEELIIGDVTNYINEMIDEKLNDQAIESKFQKTINNIEPKKPKDGKIKKIHKKNSLMNNRTINYRDPSISSYAIFKANYKCEIDDTHKTFKNDMGKIYMEGHHIIPISKQDDFEFSIDIPENILSLCPICHRVFHLADFETKKKYIEISFNLLKKRLKNNDRGIDINLVKLLKYYNINE